MLLAAARIRQANSQGPVRGLHFRSHASASAKTWRILVW